MGTDNQVFGEYCSNHKTVEEGESTEDHTEHVLLEAEFNGLEGLPTVLDHG
jgi:hypothetical protein